MDKITISLFCSILFFYASSLLPMVDMMVMMGAQQGASIACQATNSLFQTMGASLQRDHSNVENSFLQFSAEVSQAESKNAQLLGKIFTKALSHIGKEQGNQSVYAQQMQDYIQRAISIHKPPFYYILASATTFDQAFAHGTMYTPEGPLWKNIFRYGDWEYNHTDDSFYQMVNVPMISTDTTTQQQSWTKASYNNIFTEYITFAQSYEIQCEVTIYQTGYPFFVGVQFNKTRWISGNSDSLTVSRLIGIYGSSKTAIAGYYAEQPPSSFFTTQSAATQKLTQAPLQQIINATTKNISIASTLFNDLYSSPVTFVIKIITSPQKIRFKIWQKGSKEPSSFVSIKSAAPILYLYHNIGFISSGAIAQFKLIKPDELLFSNDAQTAYAKEITTLLASQ